MPPLAAISDTHSSHAMLQVPPCDVLVHAGDACGRGTWDELQACLRWMGAQPAEHKLFTPGNHDFASFQQQSRMRALAEEVGVTVLIDELVQVAGLRVWGSPWTPTFGRWVWQAPAGPAMAEKWLPIPGDIDLLLTHGPPHGHGDRTAWGPRAGCEALLEKIGQVRPRAHVFGHIHEAFGGGTIRHDDGTETAWHNVASRKLISRGVRPVTVFELD